MGRPPGSRGTTFRFTRAEVTEMEDRLQQLDNGNPSRALVHDLALQFCASPDRAGRVVVQPRQVWTWFQNRKYSHNRRRTGGAPDEQHRPLRALPPPLAASCATASGKGRTESGLVEFEAKSGRDGAWYDVVNFLALRMFETGDPEVRVRFSGFGAEEDEWINVRKCVRQRSLPCEAAECLAIVPGDLILCFQEGEEQALYFDAHVIDAERRRHDSRGCRCRFLVCFDHDRSEEIVPLRKVCRRPETDHRLQTLQASSAAASVDAQTAPKELNCSESP